MTIKYNHIFLKFNLPFVFLLLLNSLTVMKIQTIYSTLSRNISSFHDTDTFRKRFEFIHYFFLFWILKGCFSIAHKPQEHKQHSQTQGHRYLREHFDKWKVLMKRRARIYLIYLSKIPRKYIFNLYRQHSLFYRIVVKGMLSWLLSIISIS